jgi:hypothetical protein
VNSFKSNDFERIVKTAIEKHASNGYDNMTEEEFIKVLAYSIDECISKYANKIYNDMFR